MKQLVCEMCGSKDLVKQDGMFVCQACGTKYSVEEAKKMMIEGTVDVQGTVKIDNSSFVNKYLTNARRALDKQDWEEVEKYYNMVEQNVSNNIEAVFFSAYGKAMLAMSDNDYFKRQQKFDVLMNSISVIDEYYEETSENKEEVLNKIAINIDKMYAVPFVYRKEYSLAGIFNQSYGALGSEKWSRSLLDCVKSSFVVELKQIQEKHNDLYIQKLIDRFSFQPSKAKPTSIIDWLRSQF